jgi:hypothetical protein
MSFSSVARGLSGHKAVTRGERTNSDREKWRCEVYFLWLFSAPLLFERINKFVLLPSRPFRSHSLSLLLSVLSTLAPLRANSRPLAPAVGVSGLFRRVDIRPGGHYLSRRFVYFSRKKERGAAYLLGNSFGS